MRYARVGKCIYCGSSEDLSDEHIIPEGLHGQWVLPEASCRACRVETGRFEGRVLRGPFWPARVELGLKTKRPKEQPKSFPMAIVRSGHRTIEQIPVGENLPSLVLPILGPPGFLDQSAPKDAVAFKGWYVQHVGRTPEQVKLALNAEGVWVEYDYPLVDFVRMIAKIGYAFAVARLGLDRIFDPLVLDGILGRGSDLGQWVGGIGEAMPTNAENALHVAIEQTKGDFVAVVLQLFTLQPTPVYHILISKGRSDDAQQSAPRDVRDARA